MGVITISRGSYSHGKSIAEKVARKLGYECVSREILLDASREFNIPEFKLTNALEESPSIIDRIILYRKDKYIAFIQAALIYLRWLPSKEEVNQIRLLSPQIALYLESTREM